MTKKENMAYWDKIEGYVEDAIKQIAGCSVNKVNFEGVKEHGFYYDAVKESCTVIIEFLEKSCGCDFPYVDENY